VASPALAQVVAAMRQVRGKKRLDLVLDSPDPAALVRRIPAEDLFFTVREVGLSDAVELVQLATPRQFRAFLDLDCWRRDEMDPKRALPWLRAARVGSQRDERLEKAWRAKLKALDPEVMGLLFKSTLRVHSLEENEDPYIESEQYMETPEGKYLIEFLVDGVEYVAIRGVLDDLYAEDPFVAMRMVSSLSGETESELTEDALRFRNARLADMGFPDTEEALSWYAKPSIAAPRERRPGAPGGPPGMFLEIFRGGSRLGRAAERMAPASRARVERQLVGAANAVLVADSVDVGDLDAVRDAVATARGMVELGLEDAAGDDPERGAAVLTAEPVKRLFQRGFGRILALKWRAERLLRSGIAGTAGNPLLDPPLGELVTALSRKRPQFFPGIELPRGDWATPKALAFEARSFRSPAELGTAAEALATAEGLAALASRLGLVPKQADGPLAPRLSVLYLTALANERLRRGFAPAPIPAADVIAAARALGDLDDPRLAAGSAEQVLAELARNRAAELTTGELVPERVTALLVDR
jgi:hypothetical protein